MANILIVDDDVIILKIVEAALVSGGHTVVAVTNGHDALDKLLQEKFSMVITDANMPGGFSGFNLIATMRQHASYKDMPAILLTGRRDKEDVLNALKAGVDDYLIKPVDSSMLLAKVESLTNKCDDKFKFTETPLKEVAMATVNLEIVGLSEQGLSFVSPVAFQKNSKIKINCEIFKKIGISPPHLRINSCTEVTIVTINFKVGASFIGLSSTDLQNIRLWLRANHPRVQKQAS